MQSSSGTLPFKQARVGASPITDSNPRSSVRIRAPPDARFGQKNMSVQLNRIVPWGRSLDEYRRMFKLTDGDLRKKIVGCGDGPVSFNAEMSRLGYQVVSFDPVYEFPGADIRRCFDESVDAVVHQVRQHPQNYVWKYHSSLESLRLHRSSVLDNFLADYDCGKSQGRYVRDTFPATKFRDDQFELSVYSHLLFLYTDLLPLEFHIRAALEMCRIAREARIFPLLGLDCVCSRHLAPLRQQLEEMGFGTQIEPVDYELQRGANQMLRIIRANQDNS